MADFAHKFTGQADMGFTSTLHMAKPVPAIANRIFDNVTNAMKFLGQPNTSAIEGIVLSVISDSEANNGIYQVVVDTSSPNGLNLHKIGPDLTVESHIKGVKNTETSETDYVSFKVGDQENKLFTISTDMLRNGSKTLVLNGHFR